MAPNGVSSGSARLAGAMSWEEFERRLSQLLPWLRLGQFLVASASGRPGAYVQVCPEERAVRVETGSNRFLRGADALTPGQEAALVALGWEPPSDAPGGSPNFHRDLRWPVKARDVTSLTARTLAEVLGVASPAEVLLDAGSFDGSTVLARAVIAHFPWFESAWVERRTRPN